MSETDTARVSTSHPTPMLKRYMLRPTAWGILEGSLQGHHEMLDGLQADCPSRSL